MKKDGDLGVTNQTRGLRETGTAYCTHLTVDYHGSVKNDDINYYSREGCNAGERINLQMMTKISSSSAPKQA